MLFACISICSYADQPQYTKADSTKVMELLKAGKKQKKGTNLMVFFARQLRDVPYVAQTLEVNNKERLVINLRQLDCTTYVENVLALKRCIDNKKYSFADFCNTLRQIRYQQGNVSYQTRLHYFTWWVTDNTKKGFVKERQSTKFPFTKIQKINVDWMSTHSNNYPMLKANPSWISDIAKAEKSVNGQTIRYIPKE